LQRQHPAQGLLFFPFPCQCGTSHHTRGAAITHTSAKERVDQRELESHDSFELDLAGARRLLGKIMMSQDATIFVFGENQQELFFGKISAPTYLYLT
jgi:hypothetical protein